LGKPPTPMKIVASAGLVGFNVAQDLLSLDFSTPEEAPDEFRAVPFNSQKSVEVKPGLSGMPGWPWNGRALSNHRIVSKVVRM
jgi:hypothetical protein